MPFTSRLTHVLALLALLFACHGYIADIYDTIYSNPYLEKGYSARNITFTISNRCLMYPRCVIYECCSKELERSVLSYFEMEQLHSPFQCMFDDASRNYNHDACFSYDGPQCKDHFSACSYDVSLDIRLAGLMIFNETVTQPLLFDYLVTLPPTPKRVLEILDKRPIFKIIYFVQCDFKENLPVWYTEHVSDKIYLSFKADYKDWIYFPKSHLIEGRSALYVTGRLLELKQGWLYDYFVFMDDDAITVSGSVSHWEYQLNIWRPAVGVPGYGSYPTTYVEAVGHVDYIVIAYNRGALEVLHPWVLDFDGRCHWASQMVQMLEMTLLYRNHILAFGHWMVKNGAHRPYPRDCTEPFHNVKVNNVLTAPKKLKHCALEPEGSFDHGVAYGVPRPLVIPYYHLDHYSAYQQTACKSAEKGWTPLDPFCCSIDDAFHGLPGISLESQMHDSIHKYAYSVSSPTSGATGDEMQQYKEDYYFHWQGWKVIRLKDRNIRSFMSTSNAMWHYKDAPPYK